MSCGSKTCMDYYGCGAWNTLCNSSVTSVNTEALWTSVRWLSVWLSVWLSLSSRENAQGRQVTDCVAAGQEQVVSDAACAHADDDRHPTYGRPLL